MKRKFTLLLTVLFTLFTLPVNSLTVLAAEDEDIVYKDGDYEVPLTFLHEDKDEESTMQSFLKEGTSSVTIQDGKALVTTTFTSATMIKDFEVNGVKAVIENENEEKDERTYSFSIDNLDEIIDGKVAVEVEGLYDTTHDIRLKFDTNNIPVVDNDNTDSDDSSEEDPGSEDGADEDSGSEDGTEEDSGSEDGTEEDSGSEDGSEEDSGSDDGTEENTVLEDGFYTLKSSYLKEENDENSAMGSYLHDTVFFNVHDDKIEVTITVNEHETVTKFQVEGKNATEAKLDGDKRYETFVINNDLSNVNAYVEYQAPFNGDVFKGDADFRISFDEESVKEVTAEEQPGKDITNTLIQLDEGYFTIDAAYLKEDSDENSSMGGYLDDSAFVTVEDGKYFITITIDEDETVTKLQVNGKDADESVVKDNKRYETFELENLFSSLNAYVEYQAPFNGDVFKGNADFRISLDSQSVKAAKAEDKPGTETDKEDPKEEPKEDPKEEPDKDKGDKDKKEKDDALTPDKAYEINYTIFHENGSEPSVADSFFEKPGKLLEKDGKLYAQFTINNGDMVQELSTEQYGEVLIVEANDNGSVVVQFRVNNDLSDMKLNMRVVVPGLYDSKHDAILVFDKDSKQEIKVDNLLLTPSKTDNGPTVEGAKEGEELGNGNGNGNNDGKGSDTPKKPTFGSNDGDGQKVAASTNDDKKNPQTGDTSAIMFYALLLIGSLIPLAVKFKRRFV